MDFGWVGLKKNHRDIHTYIGVLTPMPEPGADSDTPIQATKPAQVHQVSCLGPRGTARPGPGLVFGVVGLSAI